WNAAEAAEKRKDGRTAREFEIALPHELTAEQRLETTRIFARAMADRYLTAVDFAIHAPNRDSNMLNHHAHILMTTRTLGPEGLGEKSLIEKENKWLLARDMPTTDMQLRDVRQLWERTANQQLAEYGHDVRIDHRSHAERGLEIEPTQHIGVHANQMDKRGVEVSRSRLDAAAAQRNAELIREKPEQVLTLISGEKSVFDRNDIARALHRYIDEAGPFQAAFAKVMASPALVELQAEKADARGNVAELARYSTRELIGIEHEMADSAVRMAETRGHGIAGRHVEAALSDHDKAIRLGVAAHVEAQVSRGDLSEVEGRAAIASARLSDEQRQAVRHITGESQIAAVVGLAGAGKSTMLSAARQAWEAQGYTVRGAALAGKAAEGLEESAGIQSRTLASYEYGWKDGRGQLGMRDVLVVDEAGMIGSRQLARFVAAAEAAGAKLVLVGDHEQLQAIGAGAPFRAIAERIGSAELSDVRRQREDWQRDASQDFARHKTADGLAAYEKRGGIKFKDSHDEARAALVRDYLADLEQRPDGSRIATAHRRADVAALNQAIREGRQERGQIGRGEEAGEKVFATRDGKRAFVTGDRIVFLENNRELGVKNGMLGTVTELEDGRITARLDGKDHDGGERIVSVAVEDYAAIDHGYATTIHKTQGATVDRAFLLAGKTMDRHLTYVGMTRHRDGAALYAGRDEFKDMADLSRRLGRAGTKETTLDYDASRAFRPAAKKPLLPSRSPLEERQDGAKIKNARSLDAARRAAVSAQHKAEYDQRMKARAEAEAPQKAAELARLRQVAADRQAEISRQPQPPQEAEAKRSLFARAADALLSRFGLRDASPAEKTPAQDNTSRTAPETAQERPKTVAPPEAQPERAKAPQKAQEAEAAPVYAPQSEFQKKAAQPAPEPQPEAFSPARALWENAVQPQPEPQRDQAAEAARALWQNATPAPMPEPTHTPERSNER
ncbi:Ti-type conjugative transfer relaxase TraA, partial [Amaricoccus sp. HAR-UPW-R2A-40]